MRALEFVLQFICGTAAMMTLMWTFLLWLT